MSFSLYHHLKASQQNHDKKTNINEALDFARKRLFIGSISIFCMFLTLGFGLTRLLFIKEKPVYSLKNRSSIPQMITDRSNIRDRNGIILATNIPTRSLYADTRVISNPLDTAQKLHDIFPHLNQQKLFKKLSSGRAFVWIQRHLTPDQQYTINRLGIPGLNFQRTERRFYPQSGLTSHVVGYTDIDNQGISGLEKYFDSSLRKGSHIQTSLDTRIQHIVRDELKKSMESFQAIGATGILMKIDTGEILALTSLPDFNPHYPYQSSESARFNRASLGLYELGSIFKLITVAIALDAKTTSIDSTYDARHPLQISHHTIHDYKPQKRWLNVPEILVYSSNIGAARLAMEFGTQTQKEYLKKLGFFDRSPIEIPERGKPLRPSTWRNINTATVSFGHGLSISPIHLTSAICTLINFGHLVKPTLLKLQDPQNQKKGEQIFSKETSQIIQQLMRLVVTEGSGKKADAHGYLVGGKTGTAEKIINGKYSRSTQISSFVAAFPMNKPQYVLLVSIDEPKGNSNTFGYSTAGWVAAPVAGEIIKKIGPILNIDPTHILNTAHQKF